MITPIDTTRLREACVDVEAAAAAVAAAEKARDNAKPRAKERAQVALFRADDNLTRAAFVLAENRASILALLDEVERLRAMINEAGEGTFNVVALLDLYHTRATEADERAALAYPRALQAAADVVLNADLSLFDDEASGLGWLDDVANCILELTEEQIEAFDAQVEREYAAAVAPREVACG